MGAKCFKEDGTDQTAVDLRERNKKRSILKNDNYFKKSAGPTYVIESRVSLAQAAKENTEKIMENQNKQITTNKIPQENVKQFSRFFGKVSNP
jgi:hypothetical protein